MGESSRPSGSQAWRGASRRPTASGRGPTTSKRGTIIGIVIAMLALVGAIAGLLFYLTPSPSPYFLALWIDEYRERRIPAPAWAEQDRRALLALPWQGTNAFTGQERHRLIQELRSLDQPRKTDEPVVVFLSGYAVTGLDGEVFLLPGDASLDDPSTWLSMRDVLRYVDGCPAGRKLLILDVMQPLVAPRGGVLVSDVAARLQPALTETLAQAPNLFILCAASPGQAALASQDLGHSVFGWYLLQGLTGEADGQNPEGKHDGRVSVRELAAYMIPRVERWAGANRHARQTPQLLGTAADFPLSVAGLSPPPQASPLDRALPEWLQKGWAVRDQWWSDASFRIAPAAFTGLETALLQAEGQWRDGREESAIQKALQASIERYQQQRQEQLGIVDLPEPRSLAQAVARGKKPPEVPTPRPLNELLALNVRVQQPKASEKDREKLTADTEAFLKTYEEKPFDLAWIVFETAVAESHPRPEEVKFLFSLLRTTRPGYEELRQLQRIAELPVDQPKDWPEESVHLYLQTVMEAERIAASDSRVLPWVSGLREETARQRRLAEDLLFGSNRLGRLRARPALEETHRRYQAIRQYIGTVQEAQRTRDEALVLLPAYEPYLEFDPSQERLWSEAAETAQILRETLQAPPAPAALTDVLPSLANRTETLRDALRRLRQPWEPASIQRRLGQSSKAGPADWQEIDALLHVPWLTAKDRAALWTLWRDVASRIQHDFQEQEQTEAGRTKLTSALPFFDPVRAERQGQSRALLRARVSLAVLRLQGAGELEPVETALSQATQTPALVPELGQKLRLAASRQQPMP